MGGVNFFSIFSFQICEKLSSYQNFPQKCSNPFFWVVVLCLFNTKTISSLQFQILGKNNFWKSYFDMPPIFFIILPFSKTLHTWINDMGNSIRIWTLEVILNNILLKRSKFYFLLFFFVSRLNNMNIIWADIFFSLQANIHKVSFLMRNDVNRICKANPIKLFWLKKYIFWCKFDHIF